MTYSSYHRNTHKMGHRIFCLLIPITPQKEILFPNLRTNRKNHQISIYTQKYHQIRGPTDLKQPDSGKFRATQHSNREFPRIFAAIFRIERGKSECVHFLSLSPSHRKNTQRKSTPYIGRFVSVVYESHKRHTHTATEKGGELGMAISLYMTTMALTTRRNIFIVECFWIRRIRLWRQATERERKRGREYHDLALCFSIEYYMARCYLALCGEVYGLNSDRIYGNWMQNSENMDRNESENIFRSIIIFWN